MGRHMDRWTDIWMGRQTDMVIPVYHPNFVVWWGGGG